MWIAHHSVLLCTFNTLCVNPQACVCVCIYTRIYIYTYTYIYWTPCLSFCWTICDNMLSFCGIQMCVILLNGFRGLPSCRNNGYSIIVHRDIWFISHELPPWLTSWWYPFISISVHLQTSVCYILIHGARSSLRKFLAVYKTSTVEEYT